MITQLIYFATLVLSIQARPQGEVVPAVAGALNPFAMFTAPFGNAITGVTNVMGGIAQSKLNMIQSLTNQGLAAAEAIPAAMMAPFATVMNGMTSMMGNAANGALGVAQGFGNDIGRMLGG